jgi:hypothetical protein
MPDDLPNAVSANEWPQEPDGFTNLKFGWTKEEVERHISLDHYSIIVDGTGNEALPYPTCGNARFSFAGVPIAAALTFTLADGLHCIYGAFPSTAFEQVKSAFINLYGQPHEVSSQAQIYPEELSKNLPEDNRQRREVNVESLLWYSSRVWMSLTSHQYLQTDGLLFIAAASFMRYRTGWEKMVEKAKAKLARSEEVYQPPGGWSEEPEGFGDLKFGMSRAEVEKMITLGKRTDIKYGNVLYEVHLKVGTITVAGTLTFGQNDTLVTISGEIERPHWEPLKTAFVSLYGKPHCYRKEEIFEQGMSETLEWSGDRVWIRLIDFPDGKIPRFCLQPSIKDAVCEVTFDIEAAVRVPPPKPPKIKVEHQPSKLVLHLPDGNHIEYPRFGPEAISMNYSWERQEGGSFVYYMDLDVTDISCVGVGETGQMRSDVFSEPNGWGNYGEGWLQVGEPTNANIRFSIESTKLPGPVPFSISRKSKPPRVLEIPTTLPRKYFRAVGDVLGEQMDYLNDWFIIGPAIPRRLGEKGLRKLARRWVNRYGFDFLTPVLNKAIPLSVSIDQLSPTRPFEQEIVDCMKRALREG